METMIYYTLFLFAFMMSNGSSSSFTKDDGTLTCNSTGMTIYLNYTKLLQRNHQFKVHFKGSNNASCITHHTTSTNNINNKTIFLQANYDECGIDIFERNGNIIYNQTILITFGANPTGSQMVFREEEIAFDVECTKLNNITVHLDGAYVNVTNLEEQTFRKSSNISWNVELIRATDSTYLTKEASTILKLGQTIYFKIALNSTENVKLSPQNCYASNAQDSSQKYYLIQDGCPNVQDGTVKVGKAINKNTVFLWENEAFRFFGSSDAVYISCDVMICESTNYDGACQMKMCAGGSYRRRRYAPLDDNVEDTAEVATITSPMFVIVEDTDAENHKTSHEAAKNYSTDIFSGRQGTIIIVLIVALVLVALFLVISKVFFSKSTF